MYRASEHIHVKCKAPANLTLIQIKGGVHEIGLRENCVISLEIRQTGIKDFTEFVARDLRGKTIKDKSGMKVAYKMKEETAKTFENLDKELRLFILEFNPTFK